MKPAYDLIYERSYCSEPSHCLEPEYLIIGSAIGTMAAKDIAAELRRQQKACSVVVLEKGPFDVPVHLGDLPGYRRWPFIDAPERLGGKLMVWGVSTPRPRVYLLNEYPYPNAQLRAQFEEVERELGVPDGIPMSGRTLEHELLARLRQALPDACVSGAPLAIDGFGRRWHPLRNVPALTAAGVRFVAHFDVTELGVGDDRILTVKGNWLDGRQYSFRPQHVIMACGLENSLPLLPNELRAPYAVRISDHHRIDCQGHLPAGSIAKGNIEELGVAVLIAELDDLEDDIRTPFHLEIKVAPCQLWKQGFMQSSDNLCVNHPDDTIYWQVQAVSAMKAPIPWESNVLDTGLRIPRIMSEADAALHGRLVASMRKVLRTIGEGQGSFAFRELTHNHHLYRALTVGEAVDQHFRSTRYTNLTVLPPTAFFRHECDANPTLKSLVLTRCAMHHLLTAN